MFAHPPNIVTAKGLLQGIQVRQGLAGTLQSLCCNLEGFPILSVRMHLPDPVQEGAITQLPPPRIDTVHELQR